MRSSAGLLLLAGIMAFTVLPTFAFAQEQPLASAEALLDAAAQQSAGIASLSADFVQEKSMAVLARPMTSQGYFCLRRGKHEGNAHGRAASKDDNGFETADSLLWAYTRPLASGFIYKNGRGALWEGSPEATRPANERESTVITAKSAIFWTGSALILRPCAPPTGLSARRPTNPCYSCIPSGSLFLQGLK